MSDDLRSRIEVRLDPKASDFGRLAYRDELVEAIRDVLEICDDADRDPDYELRGLVRAEMIRAYVSNALGVEVA